MNTGAIATYTDPNIVKRNGGKRMPKRKVTIIRGKKGQKPIKFHPGALHEQLGVPPGKPIPPGKKKAALSGAFGPLAKKRSAFAFKGALAQGRKTSAKKRVRAKYGDAFVQGMGGK
jgi:hypothetical protein